MNDDNNAAIDGLCAKIIEQRDRIEALEAALEASDTLGKYWQARAIEALGIPAALAPEQDK